MGKITKKKDGFHLSYSTYEDGLETIAKKLSTIQQTQLNKDKIILEKREKIKNHYKNIAKLYKEIEEINTGDKVLADINLLEELIKKFEEELEREGN